MKNYRLQIVVFSVFVGLSLINLSAYNKKSIDLQININKHKGRSFVSENEIKKFVEAIRTEHPELLMQGSFRADALEEALSSLDYIKEAHVSQDVAGRVFVDIQQQTPLARVMATRGSFYLTDEMEILPLSKFYTPRVVVVSGRGADSLAKVSFLNGTVGVQFYNLLLMIDKDPFWKAQIAQIEINEHFEIKLVMLVGNHIIEIGRLENLSHKFLKINTFYNKIIKSKGWQAYRKIKVQYDGQIVCE